jgi:nitronate monooxygenase
MGVGVSHWKLAQTVSRSGHLGVVSGTALDQVLARRLEDGDIGGHIRRALDHFPFPGMAARVWDRWYRPGGRRPGEPYSKPWTHVPGGPRELWELCIVTNFVEVTLAKEGHSNPVGINYMEKIQLPHLPSLFGSMLAGVSYVLMGAGIPLRIPGAIDAISRYEPASYPLTVKGGAPGEEHRLCFDPMDYVEGAPPSLTRPYFLAIVSSNTLASTLLKRANGRVHGFIVEGHIAGGHNAPPRGKLQLDAAGEPIYTERDAVDFGKFRELEVPFWLAGGYGHPEKLQEAIDCGAAGVQVGTPFAFCEESGLSAALKQSVLQRARARTAGVYTDPSASPTHFPFKVVPLEGSLTEESVYASRPRVCDLGFLREAYVNESGEVCFRCPAEPPTVYESKGGDPAECWGRKCLCNALMANIGLAQLRNGGRVEPPLVTAGNDLENLHRFLPADGLRYSARDVVETITAQLPVNSANKHTPLVRAKEESRGNSISCQ